MSEIKNSFLDLVGNTRLPPADLIVTAAIRKSRPFI